MNNIIPKLLTLCPKSRGYRIHLCLVQARKSIWLSYITQLQYQLEVAENKIFSCMRQERALQQLIDAFNMPEGSKNGRC